MTVFRGDPLSLHAQHAAEHAAQAADPPLWLLPVFLAGALILLPFAAVALGARLVNRLAARALEGLGR